MPLLWGSKCWRIVLLITAFGLFAWSLWMLVFDYLSGYHLWWYNTTVIVFAIALFGLLLLVREGIAAFYNVVKHGLHPNPAKEDEGQVAEDKDALLRTYDENE